MSTYYHVAPSTYNDGEDLLSWDAYVEKYGEEPTAWKWEEDLDTDIVCMFRSRADADDFAAEWMNGDAKILTIEIEEGEEGIHILKNDEGYDCVTRRIPAWSIISVEYCSV